MKIPLSLCPACDGRMAWPEYRGQREVFAGWAGAEDWRGEDGLDMSRHRGSKSGGGASLCESHSSGDFGGVRLLSYQMILSESHAGGDWHKARMFIHDTGKCEPHGGWDSHGAKKLPHSARRSESHGRWDLDLAGMFSDSGVLCESRGRWDSCFWGPEDDGTGLYKSHGAWDSDFFSQESGRDSLLGAGDRQRSPWVLGCVPPVTMPSP